ncbi:MAG: hypothetical protein U0T77_01335 [Chitinophagales bacterium]
MKTIKTIRSRIAMMVVLFAVAATSCQKENEIAPVTPVVPTTPVTPAVSMKPRFITTSENGINLRKEEYRYDDQGKLTLYISGSSTAAGVDSVEMQTNAVTFRLQNGNSRRREVLTFNADKTCSSIFSAADQANFVNNQLKFNSVELVRANNTPLRAIQFTYQGNKISRIQTELQFIDINYYENLPYQKGINEIPIGLKELKYFKTMEIENITSSIAYDKLIKQIIITNGRGNTELHDYAYVLDTNNRVTKITDTVTFTTPSTSSQRVFVSAIAY